MINYDQNTTPLSITGDRGEGRVKPLGRGPFFVRLHVVAWIGLLQRAERMLRLKIALIYKSLICLMREIIM